VPGVVAVSTPSRGASSQVASWSARALLTAGGAALVGGALWYARAAVVPLIVAALVSTQLLPLVDWAQRRGVARGIAIAVSLVGVVVIVAGLAWLFTSQLFGNLGGVGTSISHGADKVIAWLRDNDSWVKHHEEEVRSFLRGILPAAKEAVAGVFSAALGTLSLAAQAVSGAFLALVFLLYLLADGEGVWRWIQERFSAESRERVATAGAAAWGAAGGYVRGIVLVATIDSVVIGIGMLVVGTPHAGTLILLSFVSLFIPILGAWVSGIVIVLVALASQGAALALVMGIFILVAQQLDSMFVTPLVYRRTVNLHPIVTLTGVIVGTQLMGIIGAFLTVPMIAIGWGVWRSLEQADRATP
jgi:predicted PurR-regulated permease PerM